MSILRESTVLRRFTLTVVSGFVAASLCLSVAATAEAKTCNRGIASNTSCTISAIGTVAYTPPGGTKANLTDQFSSHVWWTTTFWSVSVSATGSAKSAWLGSKPYNATKMSLTNQVSTSGIAISASVGSGGAGISLSSSGNTVKMTSSASNTWQLNQTYSGVKFTTVFGITSASEQATGTYTFGSSSYFHTVS